MNFLEYIVMFNKIKRDKDIEFMVSENDFIEYKIGDIVIVNDLNFDNIYDNIFVVIEDNNISIPINYLYYIYDNHKNVDFVFQLNDKKIVKKIGKINSSIISEYKRKYILLNKNIRNNDRV